MEVSLQSTGFFVYIYIFLIGCMHSYSPILPLSLIQQKSEKVTEYQPVLYSTAMIPIQIKDKPESVKEKYKKKKEKRSSFVVFPKIFGSQILYLLLLTPWVISKVSFCPLCSEDCNQRKHLDTPVSQTSYFNNKELMLYHLLTWLSEVREKATSNNHQIILKVIIFWSLKIKFKSHWTLLFWFFEECATVLQVMKCNVFLLQIKWVLNKIAHI